MAPTQSKTKAAARKAAPKKTTAKRKAPAKKATAKKASTRKPAAKRDLRSAARETGRNALLAGLGVYGKAYDQVQAQIEALQQQVDNAQKQIEERRQQADALYQSLVKRGKAVEKDALKAFDDLELDSLADRVKLEAQMDKAKARFDALRAKFKKAA